MKRALVLWLGVMAIVGSPASAQDLPPELSGDFTNLPAARPKPTPAPAPVPAPAPEMEDEAVVDPELGDVGPLPGEGEPPAVEQADAEAQEAPVDEPSEAVDESSLGEPLFAAPSAIKRWSVAAGFGVGTLSFERPADGGTQHLPTTPFAAFDIEVRGWLGSETGAGVDAQVRYHTSLGMLIEVDPLFGLPENVAARVQSLVGTVAPTLRLSNGLRIGVPLGAALSWLAYQSHQYPLEPYTLGALLVGVEASAELSDNVTLRVRPEAHWILSVNSALQREGACCSGGALAANAVLQARLGETFSLALAYREQRSLLPAAGRFSAIERVATARIVGNL